MLYEDRSTGGVSNGERLVKKFNDVFTRKIFIHS